MKQRRSRPETLERIADYGKRRLAGKPYDAKAEQRLELVRAAVEPMAYLQAVAIYPYLLGASELFEWADERGYDLSLSTVLSDDVIGAYIAQRPKATFTHSVHLWRLARARGSVSQTSSVGARLPRSAYQTPYSPDELAALLEFAQCLSNEYRRHTLLTLIALGAGCGINRQLVRRVRANDVHFHGGAMFVNVGHCAKVLDEFTELLNESCAYRPEGLLIPLGKTNVTERASGWTEGFRGVPVFATDRLRAGYIVALMDSRANLRELMAWAGLRGCEALEPYLRFTKSASSSCPLNPGTP